MINPIPKKIESIEIRIGEPPEVSAHIRYVGTDSDLNILCRGENAYPHVRQLAALADLFGHLAIRFHQEIALDSQPKNPPFPMPHYGDVEGPK